MLLKGEGGETVNAQFAHMNTPLRYPADWKCDWWLYDTD